MKFYKRKKYKRRLFFYWKVLYGYDRIFWPIISYRLHLKKKFFFEKTFNFLKYTFFFKRIKSINSYFFYFFKPWINYYKNFFYFLFFKYANTYIFLFNQSQYECFFSKKKKFFLYRLILTSKQNRLYINLSDKKKKNYIYISTGFFIKFFEKKKLYKKSKLVRTLMIKFLRKIFLLLKFPNILIIFKKNPIFLLEFLLLFNQPILHKFNEPLTNREIIDEENKLLTKIKYFIFLNSENYTKNKTKKKGRVKRKISRKIIFKNKIID